MKVEMNTKDRTVYVTANDIAHNLKVIDEWIKALNVARRWLRDELIKPAPRPSGTEPLSEKQVDALKANVERTHGVKS
jgi:hypothetical protein